jgi:chromosome partitioning protein
MSDDRLRITVANVKGGTGKTTVATHLAARVAWAGLPVLLVDLDRQRASRQWVERRPRHLPRIDVLAMDADDIALPNRPSTVILDVPANLGKKRLEAVIDASDLVIVPVMPSAFDEAGTERFVRQIREMKPVRRGKVSVCVVANRVKLRSASASHLVRFVERLGLPLVSTLSEAQCYVTAAETGVTLFDQPPGRVARQLAEWAPIAGYLQPRMPALGRPEGDGSDDRG